MRINQYLARCGVCSRRGADDLIKSNKVYVNGNLASMGMDVSDKDQVIVNGKEISLPEDTVVLAYYKPVGVTCTEKDVHAERIVIDEIDSDRRLTYAGRLDKDSEGLLIMTDDGDLINSMMKSANMHEKEYIVTVNKTIKDTDLHKMEEGIYLSELERRTRPCIVHKIDDKTFDIVLTQGLNRQIRRMCKELGYSVVSLKRTRVINIKLENLQVGASRKLSKQEKNELYEIVGLHI